MAVTIQLRRDTSSGWSTANPVLAEGEIGVVTDTHTYKIGDGTTAWNSLSAQMLSPEMEQILMVGQSTDPSPPDPDKLIFYTKSFANRMIPKWQGPSGLDTAVQPAFFNNAIAMAAPNTTTSMGYLGMKSFTAVGTVSTPTIVAGSGLFLGMKRTLITSAAGAGSLASMRETDPLVYRGDGGGVGGFFFNVRFGINGDVSDSNFQIGLSATTGALTSADPSTLKSNIWLGWDSTDTNLQIIHCDTTSGATKVDLGSSFPAHTQYSVFDFTLFAAPSDSQIGYRVRRLDSPADITGVITTNMPTTTTLLTFQSKMCNVSTASAVSYALSRVYIESDT